MDVGALFIGETVHAQVFVTYRHAAQGFIGRQQALAEVGHGRLKTVRLLGVDQVAGGLQLIQQVGSLGQAAVGTTLPPELA